MAFGSVTEYYNSMYASTLHNMGKKVVNQNFVKRALLFWLMKHNRTKDVRGRSIKRPVQLRERDTAKAFGRGATFDSVDPDLITNATYEMKNVGDSLTRFWADEEENTGPEAIINLVEFNIRQTLASVQKKVQAMLWASSPGTDDITSIPQYVDTSPTTDTVAGINRANESLWRNQTKNMSGRSAYTYMLDDMLNLKNTCNKYGDIDYVITGQDEFELYAAVAREQKEITNKKMGDAEFASWGWGGIPIALDHDCTSGAMYMLSSENWEWAVSPTADFKWTEWKERPNGLDREAQLILRAQVINTQPNADGVLYNIAA